MMARLLARTLPYVGHFDPSSFDFFISLVVVLISLSCLYVLFAKPSPQVNLFDKEVSAKEIDIDRKPPGRVIDVLHASVIAGH